MLVNSSGFRVKIKHEEYVRLHKIITECSSRTVWEYLKDGKPFEELIENVPDEFFNWLTKTKQELVSQFHSLAAESLDYFSKRPKTDDRKELAEYFKQYKHPFLCFSLLDGKDCTDTIWKMLKPERELPFVTEV